MKLFEEAYEHVKRLACEMMPKGDSELRALVKVQKKETAVIQNKKFDVTHWAEYDEEKKALAVVVEARRNPIKWLGWSQVTAFGFYRCGDGSNAEFQTKDYWSHGY